MYKAVNREGMFHILKGEEPVFTPAGNPLTTRSEALAKKLAGHLETFGEKMDSLHSIACFHYPMLDFIRHYPRGIIEQQLILGFDPYNDWTLRGPQNHTHLEKWRDLFGEAKERAREGRIWIAGLQENQLCAALVLGRAVGSLNIALLASLCQDSGQREELSRKIILFNPKLGKLPLTELMDNFSFYWEI